MTAKIWGRYERLRPDQIDAIRVESPIVYVPWGAIEWHSYHNPVGLDGIKAEGLCRAMAERTGGVVFPTLFIGTDTIKPLKGFKHTIDHRQETVRQLVSEVLEQLADEGWRVIVLLTGHYGGGQVEAVRAAAQSFERAHPETGLWALADFEPLEGKFPANHAAKGETSFQMVFDPEPVDLLRVPGDRAPTLDDDGVLGDDPKNATHEEGRKMVETFLEAALPRIESMLKERA